MYVSVCVCVTVCISTIVYMYVYMYIYMCEYVYLSGRICVCVFVSVYVCVYAYTHTYTLIQTCVCLYVCIWFVSLLLYKCECMYTYVCVKVSKLVSNFRVGLENSRINSIATISLKSYSLIIYVNQYYISLVLNELLRYRMK